MNTPIVIDQPLPRKARKPKRIRSRKSFTLSTETLDALDALVTKGSASNLSRAIDEAVRFFVTNSGAFMVTLEPKSRAEFMRFCMSRGSLPGPKLADLAIEAVDIWKADYRG